jgi:hypothetical protein
MYIDFTNALGFIDHAKLLAIMSDLGYPQDGINLIGNIYSQSYTTIIDEYFGKTQSIPIQRGTIQGDTLSPYLFIIFLEPLLRWLEKDKHGYNFKNSKSSICSTAYLDDLVVIFTKITSIQPQLNEIERFFKWSGMDLGIMRNHRLSKQI